MHKTVLLIAGTLLFLSLNFSADGQGLKFEAEQGTISGSLTTGTTFPGFSGTGYVGKFENDADKVSITINPVEEGYYNFYVGYAAPYGQKINIISINGNSADLTFPSYGNSFSESFFGSVKLKAGENDVSIIKSWGWFLVDYVRIEKTDLPVNFNITKQVVTPGATSEARSLYCYLYDNFTKNIHSGVMNRQEAEWLKTNTGKYPALIGLDLINHNRPWYDKSVLINEAKDWYANNGLVTVCWHWRDPSKITDAIYTTDTDFDISKVADTNSPEYTSMIRDIDTIAKYLGKLQDARVPVLFRPLHEASGGWFWWGAKGPEPLKVLWKLLFDRLVNYHGLKNLVWVWTTDTHPDNMDWYPGDQYVDILGVDIYTINGDFGSQVLSFNKIKENFQGRKLVTLSENGVIPDVDNLIADEAGWSWFMTWHGDFTRDENINPLSHWQELLNHEYVITLDEMPDLANYPNSVVYHNSPIVGAIRWDGWVGDKGSWQIGPIVERTLGPERFHYRAPFFSVVTGKDSISIDGTTQEIMDKEIAYAKDAGIDYWAYCWYPDGCGLELARKLHQTSIYANDVKWCVVLGGFEENVSNNYGAALVADFTRENYQKVAGGRPLVYLYSSDLTKAGLDKLRAMTTAKHLKTPYVVVMDWGAVSASDYCNAIGADAISSYAALGQNNRPFAEIIPPQSITNWESFASKKPIVPWVSTGWNCRPRMDSPNPWSAYYSDATNCQDATANDIKDLLISAINWTLSNKSKTVANTIIMYAWNEHDEGYGAICPTLGTDGNPDTERLDSVKSVLQARLKDSLLIQTYNLDVVVKDSRTNQPIPGIRVKVYSQIAETDLQGIAHFDFVPDLFILNIEDNNYQAIKNKLFSINKDTTLSFTLEWKGLNVTFTLLDKKTLKKFWGVNVSLGSATQVSDAAGNVFFSVDRGNYEYSINKVSYQPENGILSIESDTSFIFYLTQTHADAKFKIKEGETPLDDAKVLVNSDSLVSNALGIALFKGLPVDFDYTYSIFKDGYTSQSGEFFLDRDTVINIAMDQNTLKSEYLFNEEKTRLWPNPVSDILYGHVPKAYSGGTVIITDLLGKEIHSSSLLNIEFSISMKEYAPGVYVLHMISGDNFSNFLFIKD